MTPAQPSSRRWVPSSLTSRLVLTVVALVAVVGVLVALATTLAMRSYLTSRLDTSVVSAAGRGVAPFVGRDSSGGHDEDESDLEHDLEVRGQGEGTLTVAYGRSPAVGGVITPRGDRRSLGSQALSVLTKVPTDGRLHTVDLPGAGTYRVTAARQEDVTLVIGLPTDEINEAVASLVGWELLLTLGGVALSGAGGFWLIRRQLRPLREVAATAHQVATLPLESGEIGRTHRVADRLTDRRTEVGQVGSALNTLLAHVESALDARHRSELQVRQFVADASHELRTPLTTIQGYAELTRRTAGGEPDPAALALAMDKVESAAARMSALVEDLLLLARLDAGRPLARDEVDLTRLALEAVADCRVLDETRRWTLDLPEQPVRTTGDALRLHQVLSNLLVNARQHTPAGTTVTVGLRQIPEGALLSVHDDGPGLPGDLAGRAFERFTRGDSARTRTSGGAGLGLSLVAAITAAHAGLVSVASSPGDTTFSVRLP